MVRHTWLAMRTDNEGLDMAEDKGVCYHHH
jgi:hypothetical protein